MDFSKALIIFAMRHFYGRLYYPRGGGHLKPTEWASDVNRGRSPWMSDPQSKYDLFYWENLDRNATSEVEYVIAKSARCIPIEVN